MSARWRWIDDGCEVEWMRALEQGDTRGKRGAGGRGSESGSSGQTLYSERWRLAGWLAG